jgi:protein-tyrosine-phosphatase
MKKVVFICKGNMFRSQVAKAFYNQFKKDDSLAVSYGTWVENENSQGEILSSYPELRIVMNELKKYNLDISGEHREQLKEEYLIDADKIVVFTEKEFIPDWLGKYEYEYWEVPNPEVHTIENIGEIIQIIKNNVLKLIK